jgi:hypothetical protein
MAFGFRKAFLPGKELGAPSFGDFTSNAAPSLTSLRISAQPQGTHYAK